MVIDPRRKRFVMNMQLRQCFASAKPLRLKISQKKSEFSGFFISKKAKGVQKTTRISKYGSKKAKLATLLHKN